MYLLAKTINKEYKPASDWLFSIFNKYNTIELSDTKIKQIKQVCNCMIYNLSRIVTNGIDYIDITLDRNMFYDKPIINGQKSKSSPIDYKAFRLFLDVMQKCGCVLDKGGFSHYDDNGDACFEQSILTLSEEIFENLYVLLQDTNKPLLESVLELRDKNRKPKQFKSVEETRAMIKELKLYNELSEQFVIRDRNGQRLFVNTMRIFNNSFEEGGRFYNAQGVVQSLPSEERSKITIDGSPVTECDYTALHPSILATEQKYDFDEGFDPYNIEIAGYDKKLLRKLAKMAMLIRLNCRNDASYVMALSQWISKNLSTKQLYKDKQIPKIIIDPMEILYAIIDNNPYLLEKFQSNAIVGLRLQCVDSSIAAKVINYFVQQNKCILCVHDSFIVKHEDQQELIEIMEWAFEDRLGSKINCKIDIKY